MIDVKAILARAEAATKGPWEYDDLMVGNKTVDVAEIMRGEDLDEPNAAFIAAAREDVPALCAEVERLRGLLRRDCDECGDRPATLMHPTLARGCCDVCGKGQGWIRINASSEAK